MAQSLINKENIVWDEEPALKKENIVWDEEPKTFLQSAKNFWDKLTEVTPGVDPDIAEFGQKFDAAESTIGRAKLDDQPIFPQGEIGPRKSNPVEKAIGPSRYQAIKQPIESVGRGLYAGVLDVGSGVASLAKTGAEVAEKYAPEPLKGLYGFEKKVATNIRDFFEKPAEEQQSIIDALPRNELGQNLAAAVRSIPTMGTAAATGGANAPLVFGALAAGQYAKEAEKEGALPEQQLAYGAIMGTIEALTERIPLGNIGNIYKNSGKRILAEYLKNIPDEMIQESVAQVASGLTKALVYQPDKYINENGVDWEAVRQTGEETLQSGLTGGLSAAIIGAPGLIVNQVSRGGPAGVVHQTIQNPEDTTGGTNTGLQEATTKAVPFQETLLENARGMTPDQVFDSVYRSGKASGILNEAAYQEAMKNPLPFQAAVDLDGMKEVNDRFGHQGGDMYIQTFGEALRSTGLQDVFHLHGDEFAAQGYSEAELRTAMEKVDDYMMNVIIETEDLRGARSQIQFRGFSYGIGSDSKRADAALYRHKAEREAAGLRHSRRSTDQAPEVAVSDGYGRDIEGYSTRFEDRPDYPSGRQGDLTEVIEPTQTKQVEPVFLSKRSKTSPVSAGVVQRDRTTPPYNEVFKDSISPVKQKSNSSVNAMAGVKSGAFNQNRTDTGLIPRQEVQSNPPAVNSEIKKDVTNALVKMVRIKDDILKVLAPTGRSPEAQGMANTIREHAAELARKKEIVFKQLKQASKALDKLPDNEKIAFMDNIETGKAQPNMALNSVAKQLRSLLDGRRDQIRALGTGKLEHFIENYFPHMWKDSEKAKNVLARIFSKRPLEGSKSFLKKRSIPTIREGIEKGLVPVSMNPVELTILKIYEMDRYIMGQKIAAEGAQWGIKFVPARQKAPEGYIKINDNMFTVYGPPTETIKEGYDENLMQGLNDFARSLGIDVKRKVKIGGQGRQGYAKGTNEVVTKFGSPETVLTHEIGHILDARYGIVERLKKMSEPGMNAWRQLDDLADLRYEGHEVTPNYKRYVRKGSEKVANLVHAYVHAPELLRKHAPLAEDVLNDIINAHPELERLRDLKPSLVLGANEAQLPIAGMRIMGHYYAPEPVATVLNNYLSPGLRGKPIFDSFRYLGNLMNQVQLSLSAFHLGVTALDSVESKVALGLEQLTQGKTGKGLANVIKGVTPLYTPFANYFKGSKVLKEYFSPGSQGAELAQVVDAMIAGGGRAKMDSFYQNSAAANFWKALKATKGTAIQGNYLETGYLGAKAIAKAPGAIIEKLAAPIMEDVVPKMKLGVFADLAANELENLGPKATREQTREAMRKVWDTVDNRMGQMVYDNLFWHKTLKDVGFLSVRSLGWNLGTIREIGGGVFVDTPAQVKRAFTGKKPELTHRMAYTLAMAFTSALFGAILTYLFTGKGPEELKDYIFIKTGKKKPNGDEMRVALPTYTKDVYAYTRAPVKTISHKVHPLISMLSDMWQNEDFYGTKIRNEDDPLVQQLKDAFGYIAKSFTPFSIRNYAERRKTGEGIGASAQALIGLTPAPSSVSKTKAQEKMSKYISDKIPRGSRTKEEYERSRLVAGLTNLLRQDSKNRPEVLKALREKKITRKQYQNIIKNSKEDSLVLSFKRLTVNEAIDVYQLGTSNEKKLWRLWLRRKLKNAGQKVDPKML